MTTHETFIPFMVQISVQNSDPTERPLQYN